jgi:hypothetical protein
MMARMRQKRSAAGIGVAACMFLVVWGLTTHGKYSASGDEPHYLLVSVSLTADRDLDVENNYAANDGRLIGHDQLTAGPHARRARDGRLLSTHDIGVPILLTPVYTVAARVASLASETTLARFRMSRGLFTYALISLTILALVAASVALLITGLTYIAPARIAAVVGAVVGLSPPILSHSFLVFPEAAAFAVACAVVWWTLNPSPSDRATFGLIAALALLPWCHRKYTIFVIACAVMMVAGGSTFWNRWTRSKQLSALCLFATPPLFLYWWTFTTWGNFGGPQMLDGVPLTFSGTGRGLAGLWLDRQYGLVAYSPIYLLLPAYWAIAAGNMPWAALPVLAMVVPMAAFVEWWGGFSPAARYLVPIVPFCAVAATYALRKKVVWWTGILLVVPQILIVGYAWQHPRTLWPIDDRNPLLMQLGALGRAYEHALPSLRYGELNHAFVTGLVLVAVNAGVVVFVWCRHRMAAQAP